MNRKNLTPSNQARNDMKKVKVTFTETVYVSIDFSNEKSSKDFYPWSLENGIYPNVKGGFSGMGKYCAFYTKKDALKIRKYFNPSK